MGQATDRSRQRVAQTRLQFKPKSLEFRANRSIRGQEAIVVVKNAGLGGGMGGYIHTGLLMQNCLTLPGV